MTDDQIPWEAPPAKMFTPPPAPPTQHLHYSARGMFHVKVVEVLILGEGIRALPEGQTSIGFRVLGYITPI